MVERGEEVGLAADWFGDERLLALYNGFDLDLYTEIGAAMRIYPVAVGGVPDPKMDPKLRQVIKTAVLGLQYGIGTRTLSGQLNLSENQTRALWRSFSGGVSTSVR